MNYSEGPHKPDSRVPPQKAEEAVIYCGEEQGRTFIAVRSRKPGSCTILEKDPDHQSGSDVGIVVCATPMLSLLLQTRYLLITTFRTRNDLNTVHKHMMTNHYRTYNQHINYTTVHEQRFTNNRSRTKCSSF